MSEIENPASTGMLDGADSEIAGCDNGINSTANANGQAPIHRWIGNLNGACRPAQLARQHADMIEHLMEGVR
jgi:hypothetical protein